MKRKEKLSFSSGLREIISPRKYDFLGMLTMQTELTLQGAKRLEAWLRSGDVSRLADLIKLTETSEGIRNNLETSLLEVLITPFDRRDFFNLSNRLDYMLGSVLSTALGLESFKLNPDETMTNMAAKLVEGMTLVLETTKMMEDHPKKAQEMVQDGNRIVGDIERIYVHGVVSLEESRGVLEIVKKLETYHHLQEASKQLGITIDTLKRIIISYS